MVLVGILLSKLHGAKEASGARDCGTHHELELPQHSLPLLHAYPFLAVLQIFEYLGHMFFPSLGKFNGLSIVYVQYLA